MADPGRDVVFIGDELTAEGYRLAGARVLTPDSSEQCVEALRQSLASARLVLISAVTAARLPSASLRAAQTDANVLVTVVPDVQDQGSLPNMAALVARTLGVAP